MPILTVSSILTHPGKHRSAHRSPARRLPVRVATSGEKALKIVYSDNPPDLILLDIMMPGLSGLEICRRLKANPDRRRIPIIFVTAMSSTEDERRGLEIGAVDYITKPISPPIVRARVRTHLALYDQSRELERMVRNAPMN
jgi:putative two-component system response regulator